MLVQLATIIADLRLRASYWGREEMEELRLGHTKRSEKCRHARMQLEEIASQYEVVGVHVTRTKGVA